MTAGPAIAIVGGGVYAARLCRLLAEALPPGGTLRLHARRPDRLARIVEPLVGRLAAGWRVAAAPSLPACVDGVDAVVLLVRIGGLAARAHDETFPERFGLVGDEGLGAGGLANGYRSAPVIAEMAATFRQHCPRAFIANLVAPLGLTTRVLCAAGLSAVGVCELPAVTLDDLCGDAGAEAQFEYAGFNHLGWFWNVRAGDRQLLPEAVRRGTVDALTFADMGAAPLRYYYEIFDVAAGGRLGLVR